MTMQNGPLITTFKALSSIDTSWILWPDAAAITGNAWLLVYAVTILAFFLIGLSIAIKYFPFLLNDFKTISNSNLPDVAIKLWFALVLVLPLFLDAGPVWFTVWWAIILRGYMNRVEKKLIISAMLCIALSGWFTGFGGKLFTYASTHLNTEIFLIEQGLETPDDIQRLQTYVLKNPKDSMASNALAIALIRKGELEQAVSLLYGCISNDPENPVYYNTMGIALAAQQKLKEAAGYFENASNLKNTDLIYYFNLSRAHLEMFNIFEADKYIEKMTELDPRETNRLLSRNTYPMYVFKNTDLQTMFKRQMADSIKGESAAGELWHAGFGVFRPEWALWGGFASLGLFLLAGLIPSDRFTRKCSRCGNTHYVGSTTEKGYPVCLQCSLIETKSKKQHAIIVQHKLMEIKHFGSINQKKTAKLELILPGLGSMLVNRTLRAVILFLVFSFGLLLIITGGVFIHSFVPSAWNYMPYLRALGAMMLVFMYLSVFNYPPIRKGI